MHLWEHAYWEKYNNSSLLWCLVLLCSLLDFSPTQYWLCYFPLFYNEQQCCAVHIIKSMTNINELCVRERESEKGGESVCVIMFQCTEVIVSGHQFFGAVIIFPVLAANETRKRKSVNAVLNCPPVTTKDHLLCCSCSCRVWWDYCNNWQL